MSNKAIFLDRDDTLIEDPGYISDPGQVRLLPGVCQALVELKKMGYLLVVVTNQSAVARAIVTEDVLAQIHQQLQKLLAHGGAAVDEIYYCPYHPSGIIPEYRRESDLRKPNPGMLLLAAEEMDINLKQSWMLGNSYRDIAAGSQAGCRTILINSPTKPEQKKPDDPMPFKKAVNIKEAVNIIKMYSRQYGTAEVSEGRRAEDKRPLTEIEETVEERKPLYRNTADKARNRYREATVEPEIETAEEIGEDEPVSEPVSGENMQSTVPDGTGYEHASGLHTEKTHHLLEEMVRHLKNVHRENMFHEFHMMKVMAGVVQVVVLFCLLVSLWLLMDPNAKATSVQTAIEYAIVFQLMVIAFYMMRDRK